MAKQTGKSGNSKGGGTSTTTTTKGNTQRGNYNSNSGSSTKGGSSYDDQYDDNDSYGSNNSKGSGGYSGSNSNDGYSSKEGSHYDDNYGADDSFGSRDSKYGSNNSNDSYGYESPSKGGSSHVDDYGGSSYDSGGSKNNGNYSNDDYEGGSTTGDSKYSGYDDNEPINDPPPYDDYNDEVVAKRPERDTSRNPEKGEGNYGQEADMVFTEEEVYGEERENNGNSDQGPSGTIRRVWVWAGGAVPNSAINNSNSNWWRNRASLGMTDYVISLNDHDFSSGLGIKSNYFNREDGNNRWRPICEILRITDSLGISPHLMVFLPPNPNLIREAAFVLTEIIENSSVTPRSIQLDLEGWWTRRSENERREGENAIQQYFVNEWRGNRPELGIGITCIGSVPQSIYGAMSKVDFAIPQMYASERNYGRPIRENSVRTHYSRAVNALGPGKKVVAGQTAYSRYVDPRVMKEMLGILLRLNHQNNSGISEVAYWSDVHLLNSSRNREFFQRLTNIVRRQGLSRGNIDSL